jgi:hypothetical protein
MNLIASARQMSSIIRVLVHHFWYGRVCKTWQSGGMAKNKIEAYSPNVLDYPSNMSLWERESLAAEAKLAAERKSKKKPSAKKLIFMPKSSAPE